MSEKTSNPQGSTPSVPEDEPSFRELMEQTSSHRGKVEIQRPSTPVQALRFEARREAADMPLKIDEAAEEFMRDGLQHREMRQLKKGKFHIGDKEQIDLHGLRRTDARKALDEFLECCLRRNIRYAIIICGKGHHSPHGKPVLRSFIRHWLIECGNILAYCPALQSDGGTGALYVLFRNRSGQHSGENRHK